MTLYVRSLITFDPLLSTWSSGNPWATDSMSLYTHIMKITVTIPKDFVFSVCFHLLEKVLLLIMMNMLCVMWRVIQMMCFSLASLTTWYRAMCYNSMWVSMLLFIFFSLWWGDVHIHATKTFVKCIPQRQGEVALCHALTPKSKRFFFFCIPLMLGIFFSLCEGNMYIVQKKKCSNVMTNKQERKDGLSLKQKLFFSVVLYNLKLYSQELEKTFNTLREMAE